MDMGVVGEVHRMSDLTEALDELVGDLSEYGMSPELRQTVGAARRWDGFPSDEDVETAADAMWHCDADEEGYEYEDFNLLPEWAQGMYQKRARAALLAVKARETDQ